jgi:hypothetical protein
MAPLALCTKYGSADGHIKQNSAYIKPSAALQARMCNNNEPVAMKKVLQDKRFKVCAGHLTCKSHGKQHMIERPPAVTFLYPGKKALQIRYWSMLQNRELQIMRVLSHPNVVKLLYFFYSSGEKVCARLHQGAGWRASEPPGTNGAIPSHWTSC